MKTKIPILLIFFRLLLGPIMIFLAYNIDQSINLLLVFFMWLGIISDVFDGIIARKLNVSSEKLRRMDSQTDLVFWLCVSWCAWVLHPDIIKKNQIAIVIIFIMEILTYVFSFLKFRKETCTHAILSKMWGILLVLCFTAIIGFGTDTYIFKITFIVGIFAHIDVYLIILLLPKWMHDIPSCYHANQLRKGLPIKRHKVFNG